MAKIKPLGDRVVLETAPREEVLKSGIVIPDTATQEKQDQGIVISVGPGKILENGQKSEMSVKEGDKVLFSKYSPSEIKIDGKEYLVVDESSILAIIE